MRRNTDCWLTYAATFWAFIFGVFHIVWAFGWYIGLDPEQSKEAFAKPLFFAYDLLVAVVCFVAVLIGLAIVQPGGRRISPGVFKVLLLSGTTLLVVRAAAGVIQALYLIATSQFSAELRIIAWELWFCLGALLWASCSWRFRRQTDGSSE